jgi:CIC family chloride channel protein
MSAVFAAAARAPITAIIILFEMTGDYRIILPLMLSTVIATTLASHLESESIYTKKLSRRGTILHGGRVVDVMQSMRVEEVMTHQTKAVPLSMKRSDLIRHLQQTRRHAVPVLDEQGKLYGVVSISDLDRSREKAGQEELKAADIATRSLATVFPDEVMWSALEIMGSRDLSSLPVVDRRDPRKLLGVIRRRNIIRAYNASILQRQDIQNRVLQARLASRSGTKFLELTVQDDSAAAGARLADLELPQSCIVVSIVRSERVLIPRGQTTLQTGDTVILFVETELEGTLRQKFGDAGGR